MYVVEYSLKLHAHFYVASTISLHFYEAYVSLKNHVVKPKVHENIKVTSKMPNHNCGYA